MQIFLSKTFNALITNWKTSGGGIVAGIAVLIAGNPALFGLAADAPVVSWAKLAAAGGLAFLGIASKDHTVTGTPPA